MNRSIILLIVFIAINSCNSHNHIERPNVLFIAVDDLKPLLGCYGENSINSPNIDKLAENGTIFLNNHCQQAVCGPTRASLLTGLYPDENRTWGFTKIRDSIPNILTLPQHFKDHGYLTVNISKIFDQRTVDNYWDSLSWTTSFPLSEEDLIPYFDKKTGPVTGYFYHSKSVKQIFQKIRDESNLKGHELIREGHKIIKPATECLDLPDNAYKDGVFANKAVEELEKAAVSGKPFFLAVGFERPHLPFTAPKKYWDMYEIDKIELADFRRKAENDYDYYYTKSPELTSYTAEDGVRIYDKLKYGQPLNEEEQKRLIHGYKASVSFIDSQIGKILTRLDELELRKKTIIVLWGDHGWHLGDHSLWGKSTNFEQATRSPLIISDPAMISRRIVQPTGFIDLFPTLCELSNIPIPDHLSGKSLVKLMQEGKDEDHLYAISQFQRDDKMGYALRSEHFRYVEWISEGLHVNPNSKMQSVVGKQLFDYRNDSLETVNVADSDAYKYVQEKLSKALRLHLDQMITNN